MAELNPEARHKLENAVNIWVATVRPSSDGDHPVRPHLTPVWFIWASEKLFICIDPKGVKSHSLAANPEIVLALEEGTHPVICEGVAAPVASPYPPVILAAFHRKYEWDITADERYNQMFEIQPRKWLTW